MNCRMRRVLMIAYRFPPAQEVGRLRTVKFCKYLPQSNWQPVVLTGNIPRGDDLSGLSEIPPELEVHRTGLPTFISNAFAGLRDLRSALASAVGACMPKSVDADTQRTAQAGALSPHSTMSRTFRNLFNWPDPVATWIPAATRKALALARSCDAIYSSGSPWSCQLVALRVRELTGLPWIMDFRDPWMQGGAAQYSLDFQRRLFEHIEARCVRNCDRLLNVTEPLTERYRAAYPDQPADKFITVANGFDSSDFEGLPAPIDKLPLTLTYAGVLASGRTAMPLIQAMSLLRNSIAPGQIRIQIIGSEPGNEIAAVKAQGLGEAFLFRPCIPYPQAIDAMARSHVALLIGSPDFDTVSMPTKLYEYFAMNKPILAMLPQGPLMERLKAASVLCVPRDNPQMIAEALVRLLNEFKDRGRITPSPMPDNVKQCTRQALAARLAAELDEQVNRRQGFVNVHAAQGPR